MSSEAKPEKATSKVMSPPGAKKPSETLSKEQILDAIKNMTVVELADLVRTLEAEFGVSAAPVVAASVPAAPAESPEAPPEEEQVEFTVILKEIGEKKIEVIKAVREVTTLGLKQAKELVEAAPQTVKEKVGKEEANTTKQKLEAAGAVVELK
jgi:large subunit ribosomal protein L7/L12